MHQRKSLDNAAKALNALHANNVPKSEFVHESIDGKSCKNYVLDIAGANFGDCKCGFSKKEHADDCMPGTKAFKTRVKREREEAERKKKEEAEAKAKAEAEAEAEAIAAAAKAKKDAEDKAKKDAEDKAKKDAEDKASATSSASSSATSASSTAEPKAAAGCCIIS